MNAAPYIAVPGAKLAPDARLAQENFVKRLFSKENAKNQKKSGLRVFSSCGLGALTVNTPSPAALRCTLGRWKGRRATVRMERKVDNSEVFRAGAPKKIGRTGLVFVSGLLFDIGNI
jgi:hypothetical protein